MDSLLGSDLRVGCNSSEVVSRVVIACDESEGANQLGVGIRDKTGGDTNAATPVPCP